jgi:hypothetical protein
MRQHRQEVFFIIAVLLCVSGGAVLAGLHGQKQDSTSQRQREIDTSQFPVVDSTVPLPIDPIERGKRETTHGFPLGGETDDFYILTGYELRSGRIFPLDKLNPGHPITRYEGADEVSFRNDLRVAVANATLPIQTR